MTTSFADRAGGADGAQVEPRPLRIAVIAPVADAVRPTSGRSIEQIVSLLTEGLVARGHEVTLFATGDSVTAGRLHSRYARGYARDESLWDWVFHETLHCADAFARATEFDLIHSHAYHYALPYVGLTAVPVLHTCHVTPDPHVLEAFAAARANVAAVSAYQATLIQVASPIGVVHNGLDVDGFAGPGEARGYLLYLGVVSRRKGAREAVEIARRVGRPLVIAGPWGDAREEIEPLVDGDRIRYLGSVDIATRNDLLAHADALLYPIATPESFGLVLVEAMASGTPVVARSLGAVAEIVEQGVTGYHAPELDSMADAVEPAVALDRAVIRQRATRFSHHDMIERYIRVYRQLVAPPGGGSR